MKTTLEKIYESNFSTVYKKTEDDGTVVTLKVLKPDVTNPMQLLQFNNEYDVLATLDIEGVRHVRAKGYHEGTPSITSEYIDGQTLADYIRTAPFNLIERLRIAVRIARTLGQIHQHNIIHRDITAANILVRSGSQDPVVTDFGQSLRLDVRTVHLSNPERLEGSIHYFSPEQTGRMNRVVDYRSDLYSLGVVLYELFTGRLPFTDADPLKLIHAHLAVYPEPVHTVNQSVPPILSEIIQVLLAKNAEDRYQSGFGLESDLQRVLVALEARVDPGTFPLSHNKVFTKYQIPQKLYGRDREIGFLLQTFEQVSNGAGQIMLVSGYSGVGKSALVNEIHKPVTAKSGYFIKGKFDQYNRNIPYNAFTQALNDYCQILLAESDAVLSAVRNRILEAVAQQGKILTDIIPDLVLVIGEQPETAKVDLVENRNRVNRLFLNFFKAITSIDHPLVLFLDDLQWADTASLDLIELLASKKDELVMLLLGAYRDNEVDAQHRLTLLQQELQKSGISLLDLKVSPLPFQEVKRMLEDTLHQVDEQDLARLIYEKTKGNAFFTLQFIRHLLDQKLLAYAEHDGRWHAELDKIRAQSFTDNVVELMIRKIRSLDAETQDLLILASIFGNTFNLSALSTIAGKEPALVLEYLWPALTEGYINPLNDSYRMFSVADLHIEPDQVLFSFAHDRIQQAAYQLIDESRRLPLHLDIGRMLYARYAGQEDYVFDIANHYNLAAGLVTDSAERLRIRDINLQAGLRAKHSNAISSSIKYLAIARDMSPADSWTADYTTYLLINRELAEAYYLSGQLHQSDELLQECKQHARTAIDKAGIYYVITLRLNIVVKYDEALEEAIRGLAELGYDFPRETTQEEIQANMGQVIAYFQAHPMADLVHAPRMEDPVAGGVMKIMDNLSTPLYLGGKTELWILHVLRKVLLSIEKGNALQTGYAFAELGLISSILGMYDLGLPAGELAMALAEKYEAEAPRQKGSTGNIVANYVYPYYKPVRVANILNLQSFKANLESGELIFAGYTLQHGLYNDFFTSDKTLQELAAEFPAAIEYSTRINHLLCLHGTMSLEMCCESLMRPDRLGQEIHSSQFSQPEFVQHCLARTEYYGPATASIFATFVYLLLGDLERAERCDKEAAGMLGPVLASATHYGTYMFGHCWLHLERKLRGQSDTVPETVDAFYAKLETWAGNCPENFGHMFQIIKGLKLETEGQREAAFNAYEEAARLATECQYFHILGIASERLAQYWSQAGRNQYAQVHWRQALLAYSHWGALTKVEQIKTRVADLETTTGSSLGLRTAPGTPTENVLSEKLDLLSVLRLSQSIGGVLTLRDLKRTILTTLMENAGASRVALIMLQGDTANLEALQDIDGTQLDDVIPLPEATTWLPVSMIQFVMRKREQLLVNDMPHNKVFNRDPYFLESTPGSVWIIPLKAQQQTTALLYLENRLVRDAFTEERVQLLRMLSYQLGISLENARLYEDLKSVNRIYQKFVPVPFLQTLGYESILNVRLGDQIQREMTIFFTDIRSYTTISETLTPEENFRFINEYLSYTAPCIESHMGFINMFTGDGIMALFTDAEQSLQAAIRLQQEVRRYNEFRIGQQEDPIKVGIGLHTGSLMLGVIGDEDRHDTGVISNEVTTASRIEGLTKMFDATILLSENTLNNIPDMSPYPHRYLGSVQVKGKTMAVKVFECYAGDTEQVRDLKLRTQEDFNQGLAAYLNKDFIEAAAHLKRVLNVNPNDVTADRYFRHAAELMVRGVGPDWSGVEIMTEK